MIIGVGIDFVEISRIKSLIVRKNIGRIFTAQEIKYCRSKKNPAESFAARFAAKEAFFKAVGTGWGTGRSPEWKEIEVVLHQEAGIGRHSPVSLRLSGRAKNIAKQLGVKHNHLSLTHSKEYAGAVVLIEGL